VRGSGIAPAVFDGLLAAARAFFALPYEQKMPAGSLALSSFGQEARQRTA
jgi:isopenicillin N synthase-like dioxygenase